MKVLITTSGVGSRLGELTQYTNKSLVRLGSKPVLSHIIDSYPKETEFIITLGYFGNHVKQFLKIAYPDRNFEFVEVDNYSGEGSSLGYSLLQAKHKLQQPFVFHANDTILPNMDVSQLRGNFCVGAEKNDSSQYASLLVDPNNRLRKLNPKGELNFDFPYVGVCGIEDYDLFWKNLEDLYLNNPQDKTLFEGSSINKMLEDVRFNFIEAKTWIDTGNTTELFRAQEYFQTELNILNKKDESVFLFDDSVIKFFSCEKTNTQRVERGHLLKNVAPKILDSSDNFFKYEKAEGALFSNIANPNSFRKFLNWANDNLWKRKNQNISEQCHSFYFDKTRKRIELFLNDQEDKGGFINGIFVNDAQSLVDLIDPDWLCDGAASSFHGDFILDNVIKTEEGFKLIDWRQDFANLLETGDMYYDLAKLNHNLTVSHKIVDQELFSYSPSNCYILINSNLESCKPILKKFVEDQGLDYHKVEVLTSLVWINMASLHDYPFNKFLFNFGKYNLQKTINNV